MNIIRSFKFTIIAVVLILIAILMPATGGQDVGIPHADKIVHAGMFFVLTSCFCIEYLMAKNKLPNMIYVVISVTGFAGLTEILQSYTPTRTMDIWDFVVDIIGSIVATGIIKLWKIKNHS